MRKHDKIADKIEKKTSCMVGIPTNNRLGKITKMAAIEKKEVQEKTSI